MARTSTGHGVPGPRFACCPLHLSSGNLKKVSDLYIKVGGLFLEKGRINAKALGHVGAPLRKQQKARVTGAEGGMG